jgi:hypothetical protein
MHKQHCVERWRITLAALDSVSFATISAGKEERREEKARAIAKGSGEKRERENG